MTYLDKDYNIKDDYVPQETKLISPRFKTWVLWGEEWMGNATDLKHGGDVYQFDSKHRKYLGITK